MDEPELRMRFSKLNIWKRGDQRAPHKPLLLLVALANCIRGADRQMPYVDIDSHLGELLREFGPPRKSFHTEYPFWRLQNDGIWELENAEHVQARASNIDAKKSELIRYGVTGGFTAGVFELLSQNEKLTLQVVADVLYAHFPASLHVDILDAVGINCCQTASQKKRDPEFRSRVLRAYEYRCVVCGLDIRMSNRDVGIEAAHIKWHQADGPDVEQNGLALCVLHHKLFDKGAFGISEELQIAISQHVHGTHGFEEWLLGFKGHALREPISRNYLPRKQYLEWHWREVFQAPARP